MNCPSCGFPMQETEASCLACGAPAPQISTPAWSVATPSTRVNLSPSHLILQAWETFKRRPWLAIGMWIVYWIFSERSNAVPSLVLPIIVLAGPIRGGYDMAMLRLIRGDDSVSFDDLFAGFSKFTSLFVTFLLYILAVIVGILLLIVPGIILLIALWPAFLLVMEDDLAPVDAIKGAWALTRGHKMELFVLVLATFVVLIAGLLAFGVGLLIAGPITQLAWIRAYHEMRQAPEGA